MTAQARYRIATLLRMARGFIHHGSHLKLKYMAYSATPRKWPISVLGWGVSLQEDRKPI